MAYPTPDTFLADFPVLDQKVNGKRLVYLDNAATTHNPQPVIDASSHYYQSINSNIHRGNHYLARLATEHHETARSRVSRFLNASRPEEVVFTSGTTAGINLVAESLRRSGRITTDSSIVISALEHHSNIVPWQMLCEETGAKLRVIPCNDDGVLDEAVYASFLEDKPAVVSLSWISNAFGTVNPIRKMIREAKQTGALFLVDAAQAVAHTTVDVTALDVDFLVFSGHKLYAPTGIGVLWGKYHLLAELPPWQGGGEMIKEVTFEKTTYNDPPFRFEAGTPNIEGAISLSSAIDYVEAIGMEEIHRYEDSLMQSAIAGLGKIPGLRFFGPDNRSGSLSFLVEGAHHYDTGVLIDQMGVAVRTGHHCCQPLMSRFGITGTVRASFGLYNTEQDVEDLCSAVEKAARMLG